MKTVLIKSGEYPLSNTLELLSLDVGLVGEEGTILVPAPNILAVLGIGNEDIKCSKCNTFLARRIRRNQVQNLSIRCWKCGYETTV